MNVIQKLYVDQKVDYEKHDQTFAFYVFQLIIYIYIINSLKEDMKNTTKNIIDL